ncbi:MAG: M55 family metallopeptidase [Gemmatimonadota bacterium]|nr:MAG: M55 family metallopeptidase [Gemmatimonadota bacterium]
MPKKHPTHLLAVLLLTALLSWSAYGQSAGLKLYISVDMEGVVGAVTGDQLGPAGFEYQLTRKLMTEEVLAAISAAREVGVTEFLISDSHGNGENLLIEMLPEDVMLVRSWPRPLMMMQGIDSTFDAAIFLGYHAGTTNPDGVRAHTISSGRLADVRLNGRSMLEAGINAAIAGYFGVPVIMMSGDDAAIAEVKTLLGDIEGAVVKWSYSFHSAKTLTPPAAYALIAEKVKAAIRRIDEFEPFVLESPITLDVRFKNYQPSQVLAYLSIVERTDAHSVRFVGSDIVEISKFLVFLNTYNAGLEP